MSWSNEQTTMLIEEYSKYPILYVTKSKDYHNKHLRSLAIKKVVASLKRIKPNVTEECVVKKFLGLRTTYSIERKKVLASIRSGMGEDEVYKPSLWYFSKLAFLNEHLTTRESKSSFAMPQSRPESQPDGDDETEETPAEDIESQVLTTGTSSPDVIIEEYDILDDGSMIMSPTSERDVSRSNTPTTRPHSPKAGSSGLKRKAAENVMRKRSRGEDPDMVVLNEVSKNISKMAGMVQEPNMETKTPERVFGEFVANMLEKIKDEEIKSEVQYEIHGLLRNAFKEQFN